MRFDKVGRVLQEFAAEETLRLLKVSGIMHIPEVGTLSYSAEKHEITFKASKDLLDKLKSEVQDD